MKTTYKPGCLTGFGLVAAVITLLLVAGFSLVWGGVLFSPGKLNANAGAELGGVSSHAALSNQCSACHTAPFAAVGMNQRCLDCHTDIQVEISDPASLHGILSADQTVENCRTCHTEHLGASSSITRLDMTGFNHDVTGFSLQAHTLFPDGSAYACKDCHTSGIANFEPSVCLDCHTELDSAYMQVHTATFGSDCLSCHDGIDSYGAAFEHDLTSFPLMGSHIPLTCDACHAGMLTMEALRQTGQACVDCHLMDDAHDGQFGTDCAVCHTTNDWEDATFDHDTTSFPLLGAHTSVECSSCHVNNVFVGTPTTCFACHEADDAHNGQFGTQCDACHSTAAWKPASFDHNNTGFPLLGAHAGVACDSCHSNGVFDGLSTACSSCHVEPEYHAGLFGSQCESCHSVTAWIPASFGGAHTFPLNHGGANSCRTCHTNNLQGYTCYTCHDQGETVQKHTEEGISDISNCIGCHPTGQEEDD